MIITCFNWSENGNIICEYAYFPLVFIGSMVDEVKCMEKNHNFGFKRGKITSCILFFCYSSYTSLGIFLWWNLVMTFAYDEMRQIFYASDSEVNLPNMTNQMKICIYWEIAKSSSMFLYLELAHLFFQLLFQCSVHIQNVRHAFR